MSSIAAWAADRDSAGLRRWLQIGLGIVWVLDAALQYQPYMFSRGFITNIIDPASSGNPAAIASSVTGAGRIPASSVRSATRAARLADRTDTKVATASTSVPAAVASEAAVAQSMTGAGYRQPYPGRTGR